MKTIVLLITFAYHSVFAQVSTNFLFRNRNPTVNDSTRCDLTPLFSWWSCEMQPKKHVREGRQYETNLITEIIYNGMVISRKTNSPPRPMQPWFHIGNGTLIRDSSEGWIVNGMVETAPGQGQFKTILLTHPPRNELRRFARRSALLERRPLPSEYSGDEENVTALEQRAYIANAMGDQDLENTYTSAAIQKDREIESQKRDDQASANDWGSQLLAQGTFPDDWKTYHVDVFALDTGTFISGMPVFDAGLSFSK